MLRRLKKDIENALRKLKWFASLLSERIRIEIMVFKLLYKSEELKKRREELLKTIGEEVYAMRGQEGSAYANKEIAAAIKELDEIEPQIKETLEQADEIGRITA